MLEKPAVLENPASVEKRAEAATAGVLRVKVAKLCRYKPACMAGCNGYQRPALQAYELCRPSAADLLDGY